MKLDDSKNKMTLQELIDTNNFINQLSVDCAIFGFHDKSLKILLLKYHELNLWAIPGGFIFEDEHLDDAAYRILYERTHLQDVYLQQFHAFGGIDRTEIGLRGDTWDFDLDIDGQTLPTIGSLFGSYKVQIDLYMCPIRLYQGRLHNNEWNLGNNMDKQ